MFQHHDRTLKHARTLLGWGGLRGLLGVTPVKSIHSAGGIDQFLFARKERMASRTNLNMQISLACRTGLESLPAGAGDGYLAIFRVNSRLHFYFSLAIVVV